MRLTKQQLESIAAVQAALEQIGKLQQSINRHVLTSELPLRQLVLPMVPVMFGTIVNEVLPEHNVMVSKAMAAGQALQVAA